MSDIDYYNEHLVDSIAGPIGQTDESTSMDRSRKLAATIAVNKGDRFFRFVNAPHMPSAVYSIARSPSVRGLSVRHTLYRILTDAASNNETIKADFLIPSSSGFLTITVLAARIIHTALSACKLLTLDEHSYTERLIGNYK